MVITKEKVSSDIVNLNDVQLRQVAEFLDYLKFKEKNKHQRQFDASEIAKLYQEFGEKDRELAESDLADYAENLNSEDAKKLLSHAAKFGFRTSIRFAVRNKPEFDLF